MFVEATEQIVDGTGPHQAFAEQPDRLGIRHLVGKTEPQKPHEGQPILDDELGLIVGEIVERLEHQDLEHQYCWKRRTPAFRSIRSLQRLGQWLLEHRPRDDAVQLLERIAHSAQPLVALVQIKETRLSPEDRTSRMESRKSQKR